MMIFTATIIANATLLILLAIVKGNRKGDIALGAVLLDAGLSSWVAVQALLGDTLEMSFDAGLVFGEVRVVVDELSAWFLLLMNFTMVTGILYGRCYLTPYVHQRSNVTLHYSCYVVNHLAMIAIYCIQHSLAFLCVWELMTLSAFIMVIFEHSKMGTLKAGINYLIQSHISIILLTIGFIWVSSSTDSYDFDAISAYSAHVIPAVSFLLFGCFFLGFAFKAGFIPFHTWLPYAHPAAPAHVSAIMSGVIIKLGIFGILRMLLLIDRNQLMIGYVILVVSFVTGVYGVMLAIIQHNLKKLLAYHSIENIGIIGMGIGLGSIGLGLDKPVLTFAGFSGALLHTLNHSLFKSLLFYSAGSVHQVTHTMNIEKLGGLIKQMPQTATLFLIASLAITGLPPLNGFVSEFLIYAGLFTGIQSDQLIHTVVIITAIFCLNLIGGLAMLCFTKAFSIVFLGSKRHHFHHEIHEEHAGKLLPTYIIAFFIIGLGVLPQLILPVVAKPVYLFAAEDTLRPVQLEFIAIAQHVSLAACSLVLVTLLILGIRSFLTASRKTSIAPTWGCGYVVSSPRLQYTANSFVRSFRKLIRPMLMMNKEEGVLEGVFPKAIHSETHPYDRLEALLINGPTKYIRAFMGKFKFVQNGSVQFYISYGIVFILITITAPLVVNAVEYLINLFKRI
jgi:formate hydrogenlyase subunit 3/multisubunit Na+/H+ antiporter MnhD subunit